MLTLLHSERPQLHTVLAILSAVGLKDFSKQFECCILALHIFTRLLYNEYLNRTAFNPIALRKTKIAYNFGLSECNRVKGFF